MGKIMLIVCLCLLGVAGWVVAGYLIYSTSKDAVRIADLGHTITQLREENRVFEQRIEGFERERSELYRQFEKAISGATGDIQDAIDTVQRLKVLSGKIAN
jgi:hypothetical protein